MSAGVESLVYVLALWLTGALAGVIGPFAANMLRGFFTQLHDEWMRDTDIAGSGAQQQRDATQRESDRLTEEARLAAQKNVGRSDADVDADLRRR